MFLRSLIFLLTIHAFSLQAVNSHANNPEKFFKESRENKYEEIGYDYLCLDNPNPYSVNIEFFHERQSLINELKDYNYSFESLWIQKFLTDIEEANAHERLSKMAPLKDISSFSGQPPVLQTLAAVIILEGINNGHFSQFAQSLCPVSKRSDPKTFALQLMNDAAKKHYIIAKRALVSYFYEIRDAKNLIYWLHSLAIDGSIDAMRAFIRIYGLGIGVEKNTKAMLMWLVLSADFGDTKAMKIMNFYNKWFANAKDLLVAKNCALQWKKKYMNYKIY